MTSSPHDAVDLVEYCNGLDSSRMGRIRLSNGVQRRNRVVYWEMDNETGRKWSAQQYAEKVIDFASAMRAIDPDVRIMMEYYSYGQKWLPHMLEIAGENIQYVIHRSTNIDFFAESLRILDRFNQKYGTDIRHCNTEWLPSPDSPEPFTSKEIPQNFQWEGHIENDYRKTSRFRITRWFYALNAAVTLLDFISIGGRFHLANFNNCVNTWGQNIIESSKEGAWLSPVGQVMHFFRRQTVLFPCEQSYRRVTSL